MNKEMKSFRLEPLTCKQLEELSKYYDRSQSRILDDIIYYYYQAVVKNDTYFNEDKIVKIIDSILSRQ